ncbi:molybdopterin cofactor-binding domain-containing protein [Streptosporangium sp. NPDC051022]|uniref:molybdopterin cofactor-binding domain-containing protein n=1 Tax=Streptosporangium sp. NPDC051022 TaxID=3155752 RepID=UPI00341FA362
MTTVHSDRSTSRIGRRVWDQEWDEKTSGALVYTTDLAPDDALHAAVVRGSVPHAEIIGIDTRRAAALPGVRAIITHADVPVNQYIHSGGPLSDRPVLAEKVVRYIGQEVAVVAADTEEQAHAAARLVRVRYKRLRPVLDIEAAGRPGAPLLHESATGNVALRFQRVFGTPSRQEDVVTLQERYRFGQQAHVCMEPSAVVASWSAQDGRMELWLSTQSPYFVRKELAHVLDLDTRNVIVHEIGVGGGFGLRSKVCEYEALAALLSMRCGRPVRLALSREEEFTAVKSRHLFETTVTTTARADGTLLDRRLDARVDNGAYSHNGPAVMIAGAAAFASLYRTLSVTVDASLLYTNKQPGGAFRGYGNPQVTFAGESQMDELAAVLDIDPIDLRIRNAHRPGDVTHAGWALESARLVECLEKARELIGWDALRALAGTGRGVGIAAGVHVSGANIFAGANRTAANVVIEGDGRVIARFGSGDAGTGQRTVVAVVVGEELGLPAEAVEVRMMDTELCPPDLGAFSSRGTYMATSAGRAAGRAAAAELRAIAAELFGTAPEEVDLDDGEVRAAGVRLTLAELLAHARDRGLPGRVEVTEEVTIDVEELDRATGRGNISGAYSFAVQAVEVEVDERTGRVRVVRAVSVHDSGTAINPIGFEGQVIGGMVMGIGAALGEEMIFQDGRTVNASYLNYALTRAPDAPRIEVVSLGEPDPKAPYGAKSIGEIVLVPTSAAVANAVAHATGVRVRELPITPDKVLGGLTADRRRRSTALWRRPSRWWIAVMRAAYPLGLHAALHRYGTRLARTPQPEPLRLDTGRTEVAEVAQLLRDGTRHPIGGGTDLLPARSQGVTAVSDVIDLCDVTDLRRMEVRPDGLAIGAAVTLAELSSAAESHGWQALAETIDSIATPQIRQVATVAGNLCQEKRCWFFRNGFDCYKRGGAACPCYALEGDHRFFHACMDGHRCQAVTPSDLATTLLALDALIACRRGTDERHVPVREFYRGPGETSLRTGEFVTGVHVENAALSRTTAFRKLDLWHGDFAMAAVCASVDVDRTGRIRDVRIAAGGVAPTPIRLEEVERGLVGTRLDEAAGSEACQEWERRAHPLRGNVWKVDATTGLVRSALEACRSRWSDSKDGAIMMSKAGTRQVKP